MCKSVQISEWHMAMTEHPNCSGNAGWRGHSGRILSSFRGIVATAHVSNLAHCMSGKNLLSLHCLNLHSLSPH